MANSKTFIIQINGIDKAISDVVSLQEAIDKASETSSIKELEHAFESLQNTFNELSRTERESEYGRALQEQMEELATTIDNAQNGIMGYREGLDKLDKAYTATNNKISMVKDAFSSTNSVLNTFGLGMEDTKGVMLAFDRVMSIVTTAQKINTLVTNIATIAQQNFNVALSANPIGLVITALVTLAGAFAVFIKQSSDASKATDENSTALKENEEAQKRVTDAINDAASEAAKSITTLKLLQKQWGELGGDLKKQEKFIHDNKEKFHELGYEVNNVSDAEKILVNNTPAVVAAIQARAKAAAAQKVATEMYQKALAKQIEIESNIFTNTLNKTVLGKKILQAPIDEMNAQGDLAIEEFIKQQQIIQEEAKKTGVSIYQHSKATNTKRKENTSNTGDELKKIEDNYQKTLKETQEIEKQNAAETIKRNKEVAKSVDDINLAHEQEKNLLENQLSNTILLNQKETKSKIENINKLGIAEQKRRELVEKEEQALANKIKAINESHNNALLSLEDQKLKKIKSLRADSDKKNMEQMSLEKTQLDIFYKDVQAKLDNIQQKDGKGFIDVKATRNNINNAIQALDLYAQKVGEAKQKVIAHYDEMLENAAKTYSKDSVEYQQVLQNKELAVTEYSEKEKDLAGKKDEYRKKDADLEKQAQAEAEEKAKIAQQKREKKWNEIKAGTTAVFGAISSIIGESLKEDKEKLDQITKQYAETVNKRKDIQNTLKSLEDEAANATGGRAVVIQEQIARQMEANAELAKQEADLAKEKEKKEKEIAKKEKQQKKIELGQKLIEGIANVALGITKALSAGPFIGQIMAAITAAAGAVQTAIIARQISKLEDGGLIRGKSHKQGGMRIDGTNIEVEGDEYVVNRISTRKNLGLIDYINRQRRELNPDDISRYYSRAGAVQQQHSLKRMYEEGGQLTNLDSLSTASAPDGDKVLEAISRINFRPVVSVVDIASAQTNVVEVKDIAGI